MARGGKRQGTPGTAYGNRTDLNQPDFEGQTYGAEVEQQQVASTIQTREAAPSPRPITPLAAPTMRPGEPVTAGLSVGPGPGPESIGMGAGIAGLLRQQYLTLPYSSSDAEDLREMIELLEQDGR